jgi:hypothetical protein
MESGKRPRGEIGSLNEVRLYPNSKGETYLIVHHEGTQYAACLLLDDKVFSQQVGRLLQNCCGMLIKDIGSLEVSPGLDLAQSYKQASGW